MKRESAPATIENNTSSRWVPLTSHRALVLDIVHFAHRIPSFPVEKTFHLANIAALRATRRPRISWSVLFLKAYAIVVANRPVLRQSFVRWPWPRLAESSANVGMLAINREHDGVDRLCWGSFRFPEQRKLTELDWRLRWYQQQALTTAFRQQIRLSRLPQPLRRLLLWWNLDVAAHKRAARLGTFSISSLAGQQALNRHHPSLLTSSLTYGPLDENGDALVTLLCDHRVLDGVAAAAALADLETAMQHEILRELSSLPIARAA
jgi:hypothetical protein